MIIYLILLLPIAVYCWLRYRFTYWKRYKVPHLPPQIPFGNLKGVGKEIHLSEALQPIYNKFKASGTPFVGTYFFFNPVFVPLDLDLIKNIYIKDFSSFHDRNLYNNEKDDPLSAHLLSLEGEKWTNLRRKLSPTFTSGKIKYMFTTITEISENFTQEIINLLNNAKQLEMKDLCSRFTTDVIGRCALGIECNSLKDPKAEFREIGRKILQEPRNGLIFDLFLSQFPELGRFFGIKTERDDVTEFFMSVLKQTIELRKKDKIRRNDFMDMMIDFMNSDDPEQKLTFNEIAAQAYLFFVAGFETSSTTLGFCLFELAINQNVQDAAREEIKNVLNKFNNELTYDCMMEMKYIQQIIDETLRKYPPISIQIRVATKNYKVPESNFVIEKGVTVALPVLAIQNDPNIYPNPDKFLPERFAPENVKARQQCTFLAFGEGPRNCIGSRFGKMSTYIGLITLLKNFKFSSGDRTTIPMKFSAKDFILTPTDGIWLNVERI